MNGESILMRRFSGNKKWFITAIGRKTGTGSDFYHYLIDYMKGWGFSTFNTMTLGYYSLLIYEQILLKLIPFGATIVTTWPGYPRQYLKLPHIINSWRFRQFIAHKRRRKWTLVVIPIDEPLEQFRNRLSPERIEKEKFQEKRLLSSADIFLCCGQVMADRFSARFPNATIIRFDVYDQFLPENDQALKIYSDSTVRIAISGNLTRMQQCATKLPKINGIKYCFTGPGGQWIPESMRDDFEYFGCIEEENFLATMRQFQYGLIIYSDDVTPYFATVVPGKLTTYLLSKLPVLCPHEYLASAEYVSRAGVGVVLDSFEGIENIINISNDEYLTMQIQVAEEAKKIKSGWHYHDALSRAGLLNV